MHRVVVLVLGCVALGAAQDLTSALENLCKNKGEAFRQEVPLVASMFRDAEAQKILKAGFTKPRSLGHYMGSAVVDAWNKKWAEQPDIITHIQADPSMYMAPTAAAPTAKPPVVRSGVAFTQPEMKQEPMVIDGFMQPVPAPALKTVPDVARLTTQWDALTDQQTGALLLHYLGFVPEETEGAPWSRITPLTQSIALWALLHHPNIAVHDETLKHMGSPDMSRYHFGWMFAHIANKDVIPDYIYEQLATWVEKQDRASVTYMFETLAPKGELKFRALLLKWSRDTENVRLRELTLSGLAKDAHDSAKARLREMRDKDSDETIRLLATEYLKQ